MICFIAENRIRDSLERELKKLNKLLNEILIK